ncbi:MAG: XRE family aerobic/anaerobic benzoate catabolism transcriptional regulator [Pseudohongiellaceae bacterium]|jgi:XRE family aerobic/anaerobic benzoate catabolism transcriptional regulator
MRPEALLSEVGRRLAEARQTLGLTMAEVANRASVSTRYLRMAEGGEANLSLLKLASLARALRQPMRELCDLELGDIPRQRIALLGVRGCGKSTVGRHLSQQLEIPFFELDDAIEVAADMSLSQLFTIHGDSHYRELQSQCLEHWLTQTGAGILATGGGIVNDEASFERLCSTCRTVWLQASPESHWARVLAQGDTRPMRDHPRAMQQLRTLLEKREALYTAADLVIDTTELPPEGVAERIVEWVGI